MIQRALATLVVVLSLVAPRPVAAAPEMQAPGNWTSVSKVTAVGDLHGSYDKAIRLLTAAGLLDEELQWAGGEQHLVVVGDFVDRGVGDRALMDFFRRLQPEAEAAGGRAHILLGNHEVMNLMRDLRYVNPESHRAWTDDEKKADRRAAWRLFSNLKTDNNKGTPSRDEFEEQYPPGYFARLKGFDREGEYGKWLLGLPAMVKVNDVVFVHGGVTVETAALGVYEVNRRLRAELIRHLEAREILEEKGAVTPLMTFGEILWMARDAVGRIDSISRALREPVQELYDSFKSPLFGEMGPLWYRGGSFEDERIEREMVVRALELMDAKAIVVAHSPTQNQQITSRFHGQLFRVDHNIGESDNLQALVVGSEEIMVLDASTGQTTQALRELPTGRFDPRAAAEKSDGELQHFLAEAEIVDSRYLGRGTTRPRLLEMQMNGEQRRGIFKTVENGDNPSPGEATDRYQHEVAAYRLDRKLGLGMVPATVLREIDGQQGSLQAWVEGAVDQEAAESYNLELFDTEMVAKQLDQGAVFDALIGNFEREPDDFLRPINRDGILLIDHSKAFSTSPELPWGEDTSVSIDSQLRDELRSLDHETLDDLLGDLISDRQIKAMLQRRDRILDRLSTASADTLAQP
ncbi:MAG: metallophosphoesterase [Thermoanaerobaculia bacterium]